MVRLGVYTAENGWNFHSRPSPGDRYRGDTFIPRSINARQVGEFRQREICRLDFEAVVRVVIPSVPHALDPLRKSALVARHRTEVFALRPGLLPPPLSPPPLFQSLCCASCGGSQRRVVGLSRMGLRVLPSLVYVLVGVGGGVVRPCSRSCRIVLDKP